jgi:hypothetical protein
MRGGIELAAYVQFLDIGVQELGELTRYEGQGF